MSVKIDAESAPRIVLDSIRRLVEALRSSSRQSEAKLGMSGAQLFVLQKLAAESGLSLNELAARTYTHQSSVSVVVSRLEEKGLVTRRKSEKDARQVTVSLTLRGKALQKKIPELAQNRISAAILELPKRDQVTLARLLVEFNIGAGFHKDPVQLFLEGDSP